MKSTKGN